MWVDVSESGASCLVEAFDRPFFFECQGKRKMMAELSDENINLKSVHGEVFQLRLDEFHNREMMLLTSTLGDTFWFFLPDPSIEGTMVRARAGQEAKASNTSWSGIIKWGTYFEEQHDRLMEHLEEQEVTLSDSFLKSMAEELLRRKKCQ